MHQVSNILFALLIALLPSILYAQDDTATFRADTRLVVLHASVADKSGKLITTLPRDSFKVLENGQPQELRVFRREDIPVSLGLVIDNSGSMRDKRQKVESAAVALVKESNKQDEVFIVNFNDDAYLDVPFTNEMAKLEEGVARIDSKGGTAMRDALSMSIDHLKSDAKRDKKVLLIITDGNDTASTGITLEKLVEKAHRNPDIMIYAIGILSDQDKSEAKKAKRALDALAKASGGATYYPKNIMEVESLAVQVANDIRNQYVLAYSPTNQNLDGTFRQIKVLANGGKYNVRTRTGYYANPQAQGRKTTAVSQAK